MGAVVPDCGNPVVPALEQHKADVSKLLREYITNLKAIKLRAGLATILRYVSSPCC
jgi:methionyl-tRNA synthetase